MSSKQEADKKQKRKPFIALTPHVSSGWAWNADESGVAAVEYAERVGGSTRRTKFHQYVEGEGTGWFVARVYDTAQEAWDALKHHHNVKLDSAEAAVKTIKVKRNAVYEAASVWFKQQQPKEG